MNNNLAPTYQKLFGAHWVLWYAASNSYSIVDADFKFLLDTYFQSETKSEFKLKLSKEDNTTDPLLLLDTLYNYLQTSNKELTIPSKEDALLFDASHRNISKQYAFNGKTIQIYFDSELVLKTIHPAIAHCCSEITTSAQATFDIYLKNDELLLFKDEQLISRVPKRDYHLIQGKFIMQLLCSLHEKKEQDWISTFHGSTITDGNTSILFVGESGKGKSTLCAILAAHGFDLLADDVSPMLSKNSHIYYNPSAISLKKGAFNILQPMVNNFENLPVIKFNKTKGELKYMPCPIPDNQHYPCQAIVLVNYQRHSETKLESITVKKLLETLIPESWLSPNSLHAQQFLEWLSSTKMYQLTYSSTNSVIAEVSELFKEHNLKLQ